MLTTSFVGRKNSLRGVCKATHQDVCKTTHTLTWERHEYYTLKKLPIRLLASFISLHTLDISYTMVDDLGPLSLYCEHPTASRRHPNGNLTAAQWHLDGI